MIKTVSLAAAAFALVLGVAVTAPVTAQAAITCDEAAKMKYPNSIVDRMKWKRECRKAYRASQDRQGPLAKMRARISS